MTPNQTHPQSTTSKSTTPKSTTQEAMQDSRDAAADVAETLSSGARDMADKLTAEGTRAAHKAQDSAADEVKDVASALRTAADELRRGSPQERSFSQLADGLADVSESMRDKDLGEIVGELNGFARRNPMVFLGGAALLGFAATRFAKASASGAPSAVGSSGPAQDDFAARQPAPAAPVTATPSAAPSSAAFRATDAGRQTPATAGTTPKTGA